jgi:hypothetical protein
MNIKNFVDKRIFLNQILVGLIVVLTSCTTATPSREFYIQDLLISVDILPSNWYLCEGPGKKGVNEGQEEGVFITFETEAPVIVRAGEDVFRYSSQRKADRHFNRFKNDYFNDNSVYNLTPWAIPEELPFVSTVADQSHFSCALKSFGYESTICIYLAQYDEFLVFSTATVQAEGKKYMDFAELEFFLSAIDQEMADHGLGRE